MAVVLLAFGLLLSLGGKVNAADGNFLDGITVDSTLDTPDDTIDGVCDDGDGNCTLRAALEEANSNPDTSTIKFNISGSGVKTFQPATGLPQITERIVIDGYTQPGARPNTAPSPLPFNGSLLIEIDGGGTQSALPEVRADNSVVKGLVINRSGGTGVLIGGDNIQIVGNYIGTDATGMVEKPNTLSGINGGTAGFQDGDNAVIGTTNPADRNIISGNNQAGITPNTGNDGWVVKGNYIGMGADGITPVSNSEPWGPGGLSIDNCSDTVVGGGEEGATNLISGNGSFGLFPDNTEGLTIQGNIIGPNYLGNAIAGNTQLGGIGLPPVNGPFSDVLIGGVGVGEGNVIAHNEGPGIVAVTIRYGGTLIDTAEKVSILGNSIHNNRTTTSFVLSTVGLGIDLFDADMFTVTTVGQGPTLNDPLDADTGPNGYINFPVLNSVSQAGTQATVNFNLDAADSPTDQYRVEFFANDTPDPSGYGEGQTFIGAATVSNGDNQKSSFTLPSSVTLAGRSISATTTALDSTTETGFGATSEFSKILLTSPQSSSDASLASTGQDFGRLLLVSLGSLIVAGAASMYGVLRTRKLR